MIDDALVDNLNPLLTDEKQRAFASHRIRKLQKQRRANLSKEFFQSSQGQSLPTPTELCDNFLLWVADQLDGRVGRIIQGKRPSDPDIQGDIGAVDAGDVLWIVDALKKSNLLEFDNVFGTTAGAAKFTARPTPAGWRRVAELQRAHIASQFAFFARKFANDDLDRVFDECLKPAVEQTGYDLRTVPQKARHIDAIIEDDIRRCRFLVADLSDDNAGAYWEAGFAEGSGKPVIYLCRDGKETHFDTAHRHTVRWDLTKLGETAKRLKAVIRNALLGDARQDD